MKGISKILLFYWVYSDLVLYLNVFKSVLKTLILYSNRSIIINHGFQVLLNDQFLSEGIPLYAFIVG